MSQLTIDIADLLARRLALVASAQNKSVAQIAVDQLTRLFEANAGGGEDSYERFFRQSGLFVEQPAEERQQPYRVLSEERLKDLAAKLGTAGSLSDVIVEERGRN